VAEFEVIWEHVQISAEKTFL